MNTRKALALLMVALLLMGLIGCGANKGAVMDAGDMAYPEYGPEYSMDED